MFVIRYWSSYLCVPKHGGRGRRRLVVGVANATVWKTVAAAKNALGQAMDNRVIPSTGVCVIVPLVVTTNENERVMVQRVVRRTGSPRKTFVNL